MRPPRRHFSIRAHLGDDHDALIGKVRFAHVQQNVPRFGRSVQIRSQRAGDDGCDARVVEEVVLNYHVGV